jgi:hypothetical protein
VTDQSSLGLKWKAQAPSVCKAYQEFGLGLNGKKIAKNALYKSVGLDTLKV